MAFFTDLGLTVLGSARISGEWADTAVGAPTTPLPLNLDQLAHHTKTALNQHDHVEERSSRVGLFLKVGSILRERDAVTTGRGDRFQLDAISVKLRAACLLFVTPRSSSSAGGKSTQHRTTVRGCQRY
jgi:hypothetical protein